jgi:chaperonin GroES
MTKGAPTMAFRPLYDRVLIKRLDAEEKIGNLYIPESAKEKPLQGEVVAVGPGVRMDNGDTRSLSVKSGDKVLFGKYAGDEVQVDGGKHLIMRESEILALIEN